MGKLGAHKTKLAGVLVIGVLFSAFMVANHRGEQRKINGQEVIFDDYGQFLISEKTVNQLLDKKIDSVVHLTAGKMDLYTLEQSLNNHPMVKSSEVYMTIDGQVKVQVEQKQPLLRIVGKGQGYINQQKEWMPLSEEAAVRVPLVFGYQDIYKDELYDFIQFVHTDDWFTSMLTGIVIEGDQGGLVLQLRTVPHQVVFGNIEDMAQKWMKYKAFFAKAKDNSDWDKIKRVDLRYKKQVVVIK